MGRACGGAGDRSPRRSLLMPTKSSATSRLTPDTVGIPPLKARWIKRTVRSKGADFREVISRSHLPALDGLRAVAVFTVVVAHSEIVIGVPGDLGVSAFFVLSGFLITRLLLREREKTGEVSIRRF